MFVEIGKGMSPNFQEVLESLQKDGEYLAFAPDTVETKTMIRLMSIKFPLLKVLISVYFCDLIQLVLKNDLEQDSCCTLMVFFV